MSLKLLKLNNNFKYNDIYNIKPIFISKDKKYLITMKGTSNASEN